MVGNSTYGYLLHARYVALLLCPSQEEITTVLRDLKNYVTEIRSGKRHSPVLSPQILLFGFWAHTQYNFQAIRAWIQTTVSR